MNDNNPNLVPWNPECVHFAQNLPSLSDLHQETMKHWLLNPWENLATTVLVQRPDSQSKHLITE